MYNITKRTFWLTLAVTFLFTSMIFSQARIVSTDYSTLKAAFDAINSGTHTGNLTIQIRSNLTETATAMLNASGVGSANYTSINIYPTGTYTISGSLANALIELRGADYVTIDGRQNQSGTTNSLTLTNSYTSTSAVIWLDSSTATTTAYGAKYNTIRNCNINGAGISSSYGIVAGSSASLTTGGVGMDYNQFLYNNINNCYYAIRIYGLSSSSKNKYNQIRYNTYTGSIMYYANYIYYHDNLTFSNNTITNINTSSTFYGLYNYYSTNSVISDNTISNITTSTSGSFYAIYNYYGDNSKIFGNRIQGNTSAYTHYAINNNYSSNTVIEKNLISDLRSNSTSGYGVFGVYITGSTSAGTNDTVRNNVIYNFTSTNYSTSSLVYNPFGIQIAGGTGHKIWNNSVNLYGSQSGSNTAGTLSAAFCVTTTSVTGLDVRNNVFTNSLTGQTGSKSYSIYAPASGCFSTINYNDYYSSGTYGILGYLASDKSTLSAWSTATGQDANSISVTPGYNGNNNLRPASGSALLSAGIALTYVPTDYLGVTRSSTNPSIGAFEQPGDFIGPTISYTPLDNTTSTNSRTFMGVTISDDSGLNISSGSAPRIYYKKTSNTNTYNDNTNTTDGWKWTETTSTTSPFSFSIDYNKLNGGISPGNIIEYFIIAQDNSSNMNISANSANFAIPPTGLNLNSTSFPVSGANNYSISAILNGNYTVGNGGTFTSLTSSGGLFHVIQGGQISGSSTFEIISDLTNETGEYSLNSWTEQGGSGYSITIKPSAASLRTISGSKAGAALVRLNGSSRVTIDGRFNSSGNYLSFINTSGASGSGSMQIISTSTSGVNNITIRNCNLATGSATTSATYGLGIGGATLGTTGDNTDNISIMNNVFTSAYNGLHIFGGSVNKADNINISDNYFGSSTLSNSIGFKAIHLQYADNATVYRNQVTNMLQSSSFDAVYLSTVTNSTISKNTIRGLTNASTNRAAAFNLITSNNLTFSNNSIYNIINNGTAGNTYACVGFYLTSGTNYLFYHNSVVLSGDRDAVTTTKPTSISACMLILGTTITGLDIRNNLFYNSQTAATNATTAKSYAVYSASANSAFSSINYNDYYVTNAQGVIGYLTSDQATITAWRTATGGDNNSFSTEPALNSTTIIRPLPNSPLLGAGTNIASVTDDIINYSRNVTIPTIGCYEQGADVTPPAINFTPITNTTYTTNRTLTNFVTITDYSGVNITTFAPRLYFKKSTDANTVTGNTAADNGWKYVSGTSVGSIFSFTVDYSIINGGSVAVNDTLNYFVVAQDLSSGVYAGYKNGIMTTEPTNVNLTSSNFPMTGYNSYIIVPAISGTFYVGAGQTYTSLSRVDGLFNKINGGALSSNVNVIITSDLLNEDGTVGLNKVPSEGGLPYYITIKPNSAMNYNISGTSATSLIRLNGADRVTIDGSFNGSGRFLTFNNSATSGTVATIHVSANAIGAKNVTVKNCIISTAFNTSSSFAIYAADNAISTSGTGVDLDNLTIDNNIIKRAYYGIYVRGTTSNFADTLRITNNQIGSNTSSEYINFRGIQIQNAKYSDISNNTVFNLQVAPSTSVAGIDLGGAFDYNTVNANKIYGIKNPSSGGWGAYGINISGGTYSRITNNMIYDISTLNYSATSNIYNPFGIRFEGGTYHKVYHNTVNLFGSQASTGTVASFTSALLITSTSVNNLDVRNNIFINSLTGVTGTKSYGIFVYTATPANAFATLDYNNYYAYGTYGILAGNGTASPFTSITAISSLQSAWGKDPNSMSVQPYLISDYDLHLTGSSVGDSRFNVVPLSGVTKDFDGETRQTPTCYVGADDVRPSIGFSTNLTLTPPDPIFCDNNSFVSLNAIPSVTGFGDGITRSVSPNFIIKWYKNDVLIDGEISNILNFSPVVQNDSAYYYLTAEFAGERTSSDIQLISVQSALGLVSQPIGANVCSSDPTLRIDVQASGTISGYQWQKETPANSGNFLNIADQNSSNLLLTLADAQQATGNYRLSVFGPGNCGQSTIYSDVASVTVTEPITNIQLEWDFDQSNICTGSSISMNAQASGTILGYRWQKLVGSAFVDLDLGKYSTANKATLSMTNLDPGDNGTYRCLITGTSTCHDAPLPTQELQITVWPLFEIAKQPEDQMLCKNESTMIYLIADGTIYSHQWKKDGVDLDPAKFRGAKSPMLFLDNMTYENSGIYTCALDIQDCSGRRIITSKPTLIYVIDKTKITRTIDPFPADLGNLAVLEVEASVEGAPQTYMPQIQWYRGGSTLIDNDRISGVKSSILTIKDLQSSDFGDDYWVVVSGLCGSDTAKNVKILYPTIDITREPVNTIVCENGRADFEITAESNLGADKIIYQWYKGMTKIENSSKYGGANTNKLSLYFVNQYDVGLDYNCVVSVAPVLVTKTSTMAELVVNQAPIIIAYPPEDISVLTGKELKLSIKTHGTSPISFQWYFNNVPINNANDSTFIIPSIQPEDAGTYFCKIKNECAELTSEICNVDVTIMALAGVDDPTEQSRLSNEPNPFNSSTEIKFLLDQKSNVRLVVTDAMGKEIDILINDTMEAGNHSIMFNSSQKDLSSGVYYYTLYNGPIVLTRQMILVK